MWIFLSVPSGSVKSSTYCFSNHSTTRRSPLITNGLKGIENRDRDFTGGYHGPILIHAGKVVDGDCFVGNEINLDFFERFGSEVVDALPRYKREYALGSIVGQADLIDVVQESSDPWFVGDYRLVLANARPIEPIPYRGALKLFDVPRSVLEQSETIASLDLCAVCGEPATVASPSGNPESVYCKRHASCARPSCTKTVEQFVLHPRMGIWCCPCILNFEEQLAK